MNLKPLLLSIFVAVLNVTTANATPAPANGSVLPFPQTPSASEMILTVDGQEVARTTVKRTVPAAFTANESFDVGTGLGSPVSLDYFDRRPFAFNGEIQDVRVALKGK